MRIDMYFSNFPEGFEPSTIGKRISEQFLSVEPESYAPQGYDGAVCGEGRFVMYAVVSLWLNALKFARAVGDSELEKRLCAQFEPFFGPKRSKCSAGNHVDFSVFGTVPLEIALLTGDGRAREMGLRYADHQWEMPDPSNPGDNGNAPYEKQVEYLHDGFSPQSRFWIEDMYMMTALQVGAYELTGDNKYIERMARQMAVYLERMQLGCGLFNHAAAAPFKWGRGNGWVAGGMPVLLGVLPEDNPYRGTILAAYRRMMAALLENQHASGLWGQLIDGDDAWDESSCSGMFAFSMIMGVKHGWLDADVYGPAARKAYLALCSKVDRFGNVGEVGAGINCGSSREFYLACPKVNGAPHGQAALLWCCNALLATP